MHLLLRAVMALGLSAQVACLPTIAEGCELITRPTPPPALPRGFAELDALLLRRANDMTLASRGLNGSLVFVFHKDFAEQLLPALCGRLEQARALAMAGRAVEAGRKYQALLVSTQVLAFAVAVHSTAQYADRRLQAAGQVSLIQEKFAAEAAPILEAALSEDPRRIERALNGHPDAFAEWAALLDAWQARVDDGAHKAKIAMVVWDIAFLMVATYQAAGVAAELVAAEGPLVPPWPAFAAGVDGSGTAALELAETLRRLIALGALDAGVVATLSRPLMMSTGEGAPRSPVTVLQTGGNTIGDGTAKALNAATGKDLSRREWGRALEALKQAHGLPPGHHGKITSAGDYLDEAGRIIDSLLGYVP